MPPNTCWNTESARGLPVLGEKAPKAPPNGEKPPAPMPMWEGSMPGSKGSPMPPKP